MMLFYIANTVCFALICLSITLGVSASKICRSRLNDFDLGDIRDFVFGCDALRQHEPFWAWIYLLNIGFTFLEGIALLARIGWAVDIGWANAGHSWGLTWVLWHGVAAGLIAWFHFGTIRIFKSYAGGADD